MTKRRIPREQTGATVGDRPRLLTARVYCGRQSFVSEMNAVVVETVGVRPGPLGKE